MRLEALAALALTSSLRVDALRPRMPFPIASGSNSTSTYGLTGTSSSTTLSSTSTDPAEVQHSSTSSPHPPASYLSPSSPAYKPTGSVSSSSPIYVPTGHASSSSLTYKPTGYVSSSSPKYKPTGYVASTGAILKPTGNSTLPPPSKCSGETLNVLNASLDWWYTRTLYYVVSTISVQFNRNDSTTGWTLLPATTPFDLASAMASPTCESSLTWNTVFNMSLWDVSCTPAPTPVAASTTVITQTAFRALNETTGTGRPPNVVRTPPPATITIPNSGGTYAQGTAFVYFSSYEIVSKSQATYGNGSVGCAEATQTFQMAEPFSFAYSDGEVNGTEQVGAGVTGDVNPAFLQVVGKSATAGSWVAAPTVAVVVQDIYAAEAVLAAKAGPFGALTMTTETILQTPEPTLPSGFTTGPPDTNFPSIGFTGHVESTAPSLAVPTHVGHPKPTKPGSGPPKVTTGPDGRTTPVTTPRNGQRPTNTKVPTDRIVSAILSAVSPTNALEVLQQAQDSFTSTKNPTVAAIVQGISPGSNTRIGTGPDGKPTLIIDGTTFIGNSKTQFVVGTATLTPGGTVVDHGTTVSLASGLTAVVVNGQTVVREGVTQTVGSASPASITAAPVLTIGGETFTAINNGFTYDIDGETLTPGGVETVTVDGKVYIVSLAPGATILEIETLGPNGAVTATTYETLTAGSGSQSTVTSVVGASSGSRPSGGPSHSVAPALANAAAPLKINFSAICLFLSTLVSTIWLWR